MQYYHLHSASLSGEAKGLGKCSNCIPTQKGTVNNLISFTFKGRLIKKQARYARKYNRVSECATEHVELLAQIKMENTVYILSPTSYFVLHTVVQNMSAVLKAVYK